MKDFNFHLLFYFSFGFIIFILNFILEKLFTYYTIIGRKLCFVSNINMKYVGTYTF